MCIPQDWFKPPCFYSEIQSVHCRCSVVFSRFNTTKLLRLQCVEVWFEILGVRVPLDDLLVIAVGDGRHLIERDGGEVVAAAQRRAGVQEAGVEHHPAGALALLAARICAVGEQICPLQMEFRRQQPRLIELLLGQLDLLALVVRVQAVLLRADHPADEIALVHAGGKLAAEDLALIAQHVQIVDDGPLGFTKRGVAIALKAEFDDIHGSVFPLLDEQVGQPIHFAFETIELFGKLQQGGLGNGGWGLLLLAGRFRGTCGLLFPLAQHLQQLGHGNRLAQASLDHGGSRGDPLGGQFVGDTDDLVGGHKRALLNG